MSGVKIIECPRDAMQGLKDFIPTQTKIDYLNHLLQIGFHTLDFGSFVSPKAIPQLADTSKVLKGLDLENTNTKLLAIIANERGARDAVEFEEIDLLGYPFSVSETFQQRNTNASIEQSLTRVEAIQELCLKSNKQLVLYLSMAFGNPYGDPFHEDVVAGWVEKLKDLEIGVFALSDTIGVSEPGIIERLFSTIVSEFPNLEIGAHFHTKPNEWKIKVEAAYNNGCRRFDGAISGYGGCPMADDELTGNMPTENLVQFFKEVEEPLEIEEDLLTEAISRASMIFP